MTRAKDISKIITDADLSGTLDVAGTITADVTRTSGTNTDAIFLSDNVTGAQTSGYGTRIVGLSNGNSAKSAIAFEADGGTNNDTAISLYTQPAAGSLKRRLHVGLGGDISFYEDTGTTPKLFWDSSAERLGIGTSSPSSDLHILGTTGLRINNSDDTTNLALLNFDNNESPALSLYSNDTTTVRIHSEGNSFFNGGNVGIGISSPDTTTQISKSTTSTDGSVYPTLKIENTSAGTGNSYARFQVNGGNGTTTFTLLADGRSSNSDVSLRTNTSTPMSFYTNGTERMRIPVSDSRSVLSIGDTAVYTGIISTTATNSSLISMNSGGGSEIVLSHHDALSTSGLGAISFNRGTANLASIDGACDGATNSGSLKFRTTASGGSITERMRITNEGFSKFTSSGSFRGATGQYHEFTSDDSGDATLTTQNSNGSYTGDIYQAIAHRSASSAYRFLRCFSGNATDVEAFIAGDGNAYADGSWNGGGADYAEYFEWADGNTDNEDRRGYTVVLDNNKIRKATSDDNPSVIIGVISGNPSMVGDSDVEQWKHKYQRDDYGTYILDDNDERVLNTEYDENQEYVSRRNRQEWDTVGLMGKLRIRKNQPTGSNWIKMRDVSETVEEWLVR